MFTIMCSQRMWRVVRHWERATPAKHDTGALLGPWAATTWRENGPELVLLVEASTYLTLAFPLGPAAEFHEECARALKAILEDIDVPASRIAPELSAIRSAPLMPLRNPDLREALREVQYMCGIECLYHTDLRRVQANLSELPHAPPPHHVAIGNARHLFGLPVRGSLPGPPATRGVH